MSTDVRLTSPQGTIGDAARMMKDAGTMLPDRFRQLFA